jgi:hypothetical protein
MAAISSSKQYMPQPAKIDYLALAKTCDTLTTFAVPYYKVPGIVYSLCEKLAAQAEDLASPAQYVNSDDCCNANFSDASANHRHAARTC